MRALMEILCAMSVLLGAFACRGPYFNILGVKQNYDNFIAQYGDNITIFCSGTDSKNLNIMHQTYSMDDGIQTTEIVNRTTIKLFVEILEIESHEFTCTDEVTTCAVKLTVSVKPVISILSPNARHKWIGNEVNYIVPIAEDYEVICSGNSKLRILKDGYNVRTRRINDTAVVTAKRHEKEHLELWYECEHELNYGTGSLMVAFDYPPAAVNFWCIENDFQINCHWSVLSQYATFTLFYVDKDGKSMRLYEDHIGTKRNRSCEWSMDDVWNHGLKVDETLSLVMQSCNPIYCLNETYNFNIDNIKKVEPPVDLKVLKTWSQTAVVTWKEFDIAFGDNFSRSLEYKVTYRMPGMIELDIDASSLVVTCISEGSLINVCEGKIDLPCPGKRYQINIFRKQAITPRTVGAYWSEPATVDLRTDIRTDDTEVIDPTSICDDAPELIEVREELKATERKLDSLSRICRDKKLDVCSNTLSLVCIRLNNTVAEFERSIYSRLFDKGLK